MVRNTTLKHKGRKYTITFDEYNVLDTVERDDGKLMASTSAVCKRILANQDRIRLGMIPDGFEKA